jgi:hypothetical protein
VTAGRRRPRAGIEDVELATALQDHAAGSLTDMAAANLIIGHEVWLRRRDFQEEFLRARYCHPTCPPSVAIRWRAAIAALNQGLLPCSGTEADLLRVAASLATDLPLQLHRALGSFDHRNITLITDAITIANGGQPHRCP